MEEDLRSLAKEVAEAEVIFVLDTYSLDAVLLLTPGIADLVPPNPEKSAKLG